MQNFADSEERREESAFTFFWHISVRVHLAALGEIAVAQHVVQDFSGENVKSVSMPWVGVRAAV